MWLAQISGELPSHRATASCHVTCPIWAGSQAWAGLTKDSPLQSGLEGWDGPTDYQLPSLTRDPTKLPAET